MQQKKSLGKEQKNDVNCVAFVVANGITTTGDLEEWVVRPETLVKALKMPSSCIPNAMSVLSEIEDRPMGWVGWWIRRASLAKSKCGCGMGGFTSQMTVRSSLRPERGL